MTKPRLVGDERVRTHDEIEWWSQAREAGARKRGLLNCRGKKRAKGTMRGEIGIDDRVTVRDLWRMQDIGVCEFQFTQQIAPHGAGLYKLTPVRD